MQHPISESDLILSPDHRIYHLNLRPEDVADKVILVGDPDRVKMISQHFDKIESKNHEREFVTHTGYIGIQRLTVISTGISTANVDIVLNELDALVNIDFNTRLIKEKKRSLKIIRIGTSGSLQKDIGLDSIVASTHGIALSNLMHFYPYENSAEEQSIIESFVGQIDFNQRGIYPTIHSANSSLLKLFSSNCQTGITITCPGFYAPQARSLRVQPNLSNLVNQLSQFQHQQHRITNFEMETAAIYGLGQLLGHQCLSLSAIVADRINNRFSKNHQRTIQNLITLVLEKF